VTVELLDQDTPAAVAFFLAWILPMTGDPVDPTALGMRRPDAHLASLPFWMVNVITEADDPDSGYSDGVVSMHYFDTTDTLALRGSRLMHRRMLYLAHNPLTSRSRAGRTTETTRSRGSSAGTATASHSSRLLVASRQTPQSAGFPSGSTPSERITMALAIPSTGTDWETGGFNDIDSRFFLRGGRQAVLIRQSRGALTDMSPAVWSPAALDGTLRGDLFAQKRVAAATGSPTPSRTTAGCCSAPSRKATARPRSPSSTTTTSWSSR
jgi:hypothetical protein